jgi:citrate lyase subunit beta / citryl-CoA lyase
VNTPIRQEPLRLYRSLLFAPANHPRRAAKVFTAGADVAILDLEDAVAVAEKSPARAAAVAALSQPRASAGYVRINGFASECCYPDLVTVVGPWLDGVVLPKTESGRELATLDWVLTQLERERGLALGRIDLVPLVESARGIAALEDICATTARVRRIAFGGGDYSLDVGLTWTMEESEFAFARGRLVNCSRAAGLEAPIDTVLLEIRDQDRFRASAERARAFGFQGKLCIHPDQVSLANAAFAPSPAEIARAEDIVAAFAAAEAAGTAAIQVHGQFVDYPVVQQARRLLARAARARSAG